MSATHSHQGEGCHHSQKWGVLNQSAARLFLVQGQSQGPPTHCMSSAARVLDAAEKSQARARASPSPLPFMSKPRKRKASLKSATLGPVPWTIQKMARVCRQNLPRFDHGIALWTQHWVPMFLEVLFGEDPGPSYFKRNGKLGARR